MQSEINFSYPHSPGHRGVDTSIEAARLVKNVSELHQAILDAIADAGPMTDYELAAHIGIEFRKVQPRRSELAAMSPAKVIDSGVRRKTPYGRNAIAWKLP